MCTVINKLSSDKSENLSGLPTVLKYGTLALICLLAFSIRLFAVVRYESVIHEFDPYFNFRTTKYLAHEGFLEFLNWFDDRGWFPLGRTIGGTIYPGLMLTAALLHWFLNFFYITVNIRNVCVFLAPLFSANAAVASYLLTEEVTKRSSTALLAAAFTAIVPSYISRSVGGSYDNEGVAIFALIFTFYLWVKSVNTGSLMWACFCALSYYYMVAAWGGYVFIINVIPIYVLLMLAAGRYSSRLYIAYSCFYVMGSLMAMTVPFVGFNVINQAECAGSHGVFVAIQAYALIEFLSKKVSVKLLLRLVGVIVGTVVGIVAIALIYMQISGQIQWSGRSLTLLDPTYASKYIPIIASVSEHQPTTWSSFFFDLHMLVVMAPLGLAVLFKRPSDAAIFVILYGTISWYFAGVMVRLMLTLAPIACILAAIGISNILLRFSSHIKQWFTALWLDITSNDSVLSLRDSVAFSPLYALLVITGITGILVTYNYHSAYVASMAYSSPSIVIDAGVDRYTGRRIMWDDYREAYFWLRQNTHEDSKILSWWDYGYQMSAMANRTVLVDNNTWNNTHIATVGRALASTEEDAYPIFESLDVDYVLVIFGGLTGYSSDDINKFLWPVRIGSGVYPDDMPGERDFYSPSGQFDIGVGGAPALLNCVAYKLCYYKFDKIKNEGVPPGFDRARNRQVGVKNIKLQTMEEAFTSEHWIVRIYKVKKRKPFEPIPGFKAKVLTKKSSGSSSSSSSSSRKDSKKPDKKESKKVVDDDEEGSSLPPTSYVGCFSSEVFFDDDRIYGGGPAGAMFDVAGQQAVSLNKKYFAIARVGEDGHAFAFDSFTAKGTKAAQQGGDIDDDACRRPCIDDQTKLCGCADGGCHPFPKPEGEEHNRRWSVYKFD